MSNIPPDLARSPVFERGNGLHPGLVRSGSSWGVGLGVVGACVLGVITFMSLSSARQARQAQPVAEVVPPPKPAPIVVAQAPAPAPILVQAAAPQPLPQVTPAPNNRAPAMVVDFSQAPAAGTVATTVAQVGAPGTATATDDKLSPDERFSAKVGNSNVDVAHSSRLRDLTHTAPQGTIIPAVLKPQSIPTCPVSCAPWSAAMCAALTAPRC